MPSEGLLAALEVTQELADAGEYETARRFVEAVNRAGVPATAPRAYLLALARRLA